MKLQLKKDLHIIVSKTQHNKLKKIRNKIKRETQVLLSFNSIIAMILDCIDIKQLNRKVRLLKEVTDTDIPKVTRHITHCDTIIIIEDKDEDVITCPICMKELNVNDMEIKYN